MPEVQDLPVKALKPNPDQPRKEFSEDELRGLATSIERVGVLQPITVRPNGKGYVILFGERRWRAAKQAGLATIPCIVQETPDADAKAALAGAVIENVTRADLNPIEEGDAYRVLLELHGEDELASLIGRPVERVRDRIVLSKLPTTARDALVSGDLTLAAARMLSFVHEQDNRIGEALAEGAARGAYSWHDLTDPWRCLSALHRSDPTKRSEECEACGGVGYSETEEGEEIECEACEGQAYRVVDVPEAQPWPEHFAFPIGRYGDEVGEHMIDRLPAEVQDRILAAEVKAKDFREALGERKYYIGNPPEPVIVPETPYADAAVAARVIVEIPTSHMRTVHVITSPEFVAEYLPSAYEEAVEEYVSQKQKKASAGAKAAKAEMSDEGAAEAERVAAERAAEREKAAKERAAARSFNDDLGIALARIGEVKITTDAMKLLARTVIGHTQASDWNGRRGEGAAMWHRYIRGDWERRKNGDPVYPRSSVDRAKFAEQIDAEFEKAIAKAKKPEQVLAVLVRYLGAQLADARGLANADLEGSLPYRAPGWRAFVVKQLPPGLRKRVPASNGRSGSSYAWD